MRNQGIAALNFATNMRILGSCTAIPAVASKERVWR
jgi:hypothetical protein